jgi:hypothetical protein
MQNKDAHLYENWEIRSKWFLLLMEEVDGMI